MSLNPESEPDVTENTAGLNSEETLNDWLDREAQAEEMIPVLGRLYRRNNVVPSIHGRALINRSAVGILKLHRFARQIDGSPLNVAETLPLVKELDSLDLAAASIDVARLAVKYRTEGQGRELKDFLAEELAEIAGKGGEGAQEPRDVVLYGFGRIGRLVARLLIEHAGGGYGLRLRAVVVRPTGKNDLAKRASLLRRDSVHGPFDGTITIDEDNDTIRANGTLIQFIYANDPSQVDYEAYGIKNAIVVDNTGKWRDAEGLGQHLQSAGVSQVLLTAPGKGELKNIVHGVNHKDIADDDTILSAASCTTNAITPVLKVLNDKYGIVHGHVETVHSYTNDQNLIDNMHKGDRRGRSAALNMVITETGAASAVAKALPELKGKLTGNAIRVPTPDVSMAILNLQLENEVEKDEVNAYLREISLSTPMRKQIDYTSSSEIVSTDFVGSRQAGVVDGLATIAQGKSLVLYVWYDNEFGYSCQVLRVLETMAKANFTLYPPLEG
ncbi:glyceraldehyde-3-phosphate dehydrogenase [Falsarthrobacter nasiphocae]|uniref:Glyceraldehyde-3-phosphate dehydrogenase n=1 Tax=Falsarthrobacter nasiphocae TaxID=189863 RepID=A0AAE3YHM9_9MICC|nr:glyceraldehyde-3-phosphate dehydrogenase [Falsarthrobacter nasiphocae]MDR6892892.1 glyceraldehyde 3-phosphate dehydrogenase [Falsarthrobacter nasiphocae]